MSRELVVSEGREADVRGVFGRDGIWPELLGKSAGYLGSELVCKSRVERRYRILDYWSSHWNFEFFRERRCDELERFAQWIKLEGLLKREIILGAYYTDESGPDENIVPA